MQRTLHRKIASTKVSLFEGNGVGPEVVDSMVKVFDAAQVPITWEPSEITCMDAKHPSTAIDSHGLFSLKNNKVGIKGPVYNPPALGETLALVQVRKNLGLYAKMQVCKSISGISNRFPKTDVLCFTDNFEGCYSPTQIQTMPSVLEVSKPTSFAQTKQIAQFAFEYAKKQSRKSITALHKVHDQNSLFFKGCREVAKHFPDLEYHESNLHTASGRVLKEPQNFDCVISNNLHGNLFGSICAGMVGGVQLCPVANYGREVALFETSHGCASNIAHKNLANPTGMILSGVLMLEYLNLYEHSQKVQKALFSTLERGQMLTHDLGGDSTLSQFTKAIILSL